MLLSAHTSTQCEAELFDGLHDIGVATAITCAGMVVRISSIQRSSSPLIINVSECADIYVDSHEDCRIFLLTLHCVTDDDEILRNSS